MPWPWKALTGIIALIDCQHHGLLAPEQHIRNFVIRCGGAGFDVTDHYDHVCGINGDLRLTPHKLQHMAVGLRLDAAGIHQLKVPSVPVALSIEPIPGDTGGILYNGGPTTGQLIKQHGLAHIGSAHDSNQWLCQMRHLLLII